MLFVPKMGSFPWGLGVTRLSPPLHPLRQAQWHTRLPFTCPFLWLARILAPILLSLLPPACLLTASKHTFSLTHPQNASQAATSNLGAGRHLGSFSPLLPMTAPCHRMQPPSSRCWFFLLPPFPSTLGGKQEATAFLPAPPQFLLLNSPTIWTCHQLLCGLIGY